MWVKEWWEYYSAKQSEDDLGKQLEDYSAKQLEDDLEKLSGWWLVGQRQQYVLS